MDLRIKAFYCGHPNCISVDVLEDGKLDRAVAIEDHWTVNQKTIERAMPNLISHETIEFLIHTLCPENVDDVHDLIGKKQNIKDYARSSDGIVFKRRGQVVMNPWQHWRGRISLSFKKYKLTRPPREIAHETIVKLVTEKIVRLPDGAYLIYPLSYNRDDIETKMKLAWFDGRFTCYITRGGELFLFKTYGLPFMKQLVKLVTKGGRPKGLTKKMDAELRKKAIMIIKAAEPALLLPML